MGMGRPSTVKQSTTACALLSYTQRTRHSFADVAHSPASINLALHALCTMQACMSGERLAGAAGSTAGPLQTSRRRLPDAATCLGGLRHKLRGRLGSAALRQRVGKGCSCSGSSIKVPEVPASHTRRRAPQCRSSPDQSGDVQVPDTPPSSEVTAAAIVVLSKVSHTSAHSSWCIIFSNGHTLFLASEVHCHRQCAAE